MDAQLLHMTEDISLVIVEDDAAINFEFTEACGEMSLYIAPDYYHPCFRAHSCWLC